MESTIDPDDCLAITSHGARGVVRKSLSQGESHRGLTIALEVPVILGRRDNGHEVRPALGRFSYLLHHHAIGLRIELLPIRRDLLVAGQEVVVAEVAAKFFLRCRYATLRQYNTGNKQENRNKTMDFRHSTPGKD